MEEFKQVVDTLEELEDEKVDLKTLYEAGEDGKYVLRDSLKTPKKSEDQIKLEESEERERKSKEEIELRKAERDNVEKQIQIKEKQIEISEGELKQKYEAERQEQERKLNSANADIKRMNEQHEKLMHSMERQDEKMKKVLTENEIFRKKEHERNVYKKLEPLFESYGITDSAYRDDIHAEATKIFQHDEKEGMIGVDSKGIQIFVTSQDGKDSTPITPAAWLEKQLREGKKAVMWQQGCNKFANKGSDIKLSDPALQDMNPIERGRSEISRRIQELSNRTGNNF